MRTVSINEDYDDIEPFPNEVFSPVLCKSSKKTVSCFHEYNGKDRIITGDSNAGANNKLFQKYAYPES